jgi:hypothetical protein
MAKQHLQHIQIRGNRTRNHNPDGKTTSTVGFFFLDRGCDFLYGSILSICVVDVVLPSGLWFLVRFPSICMCCWCCFAIRIVTYKYEGTVQEITIRMAKQHLQHIQIRGNRTRNHNPDGKTTSTTHIDNIVISNTVTSYFCVLCHSWDFSRSGCDLLYGSLLFLCIVSLVGFIK